MACNVDLISTQSSKMMPGCKQGLTENALSNSLNDARISTTTKLKVKTTDNTGAIPNVVANRTNATAKATI